MKRLFVPILLGLCLAGCKSEAPVCDPFFGRTTIPPPPTGAVTGRAVDPGYQPPPMLPPPSQAAPGVAAPAGQMPAQPPSSQVQPSLPPTTGGAAAVPSGSASNVAIPRPSSTAPGVKPAARSSPIVAPPAMSDTRYTPPGGSYDYRGAPAAPSQPAPGSSTGVRATTTSGGGFATIRSNAAVDDRMPRPVDDSSAEGSPTGQKPIVQTLQPRTVIESSNRPVDIVDLPKAR